MLHSSVAQWWNVSRCLTVSNIEIDIILLHSSEPHLAVSWRPLVLAEAEVTLLLTSASCCCSWPRLCSCSSPCSWSGMSARWLCRLLVLRVGVAGPGRGRGELRLAQLPAELLTSWLAAAGGSSELVLHDEKLELLCFLQHNTSNILRCSRYFP